MLLQVPDMVVMVVAHEQPHLAKAELTQMVPGEVVKHLQAPLEKKDLLETLWEQPRLFIVVELRDAQTMQAIRAIAKKAFVAVRLVVVSEPRITNLKWWVNMGFKRAYAAAQADFPKLQFHYDKMPADHTHLTGPFDLIGDIHGCFDELHELLLQMDYAVERHEDGSFTVVPPQGRKVIFLGDLGDRGPDSPAVFQLVMDMIDAGTGMCVLGNHDFKLLRYLEGHAAKPSHGFQVTLEQLANYDDAFHKRLHRHMSTLPSHLVLDGGKLVACHAGLPENMHKRNSGKVKSHAVFGKTTGERDARGFPIRVDWAKDYSGDATVVYGHTPLEKTGWVNNTICLDTACVFGGSLTALRYPEMELVSVPAKATHYTVASAESADA